MRRRILFLGSAISALTTLPLAAFAASSDFFGPIIPQSGSCVCPHSAMDWGCVLQVLQNLLNAGESIAVLVSVLSIAVGGFALITSGSKPLAREKAKNRILNSVLGLAVVLGSWLMVDTVMKLFYDPNTAFEGGTFGPWNSLTDAPAGSECIKPNNNPLGFSNGNVIDVIGGIATDVLNPGTNQSTMGVTPGSGNCSPETLTSAASAGGYQLSSAQATTLSCIAKAESSCGKVLTGATTVTGKATSANGMFQIVLGNNDTCHNLNLPVCTAAANRAGYQIQGNLNCSTAFRGGKPIAGSTLAKACQAAAANTACNTSAAACLLSKHPSYSDWLADSRSSRQAACVAKYAH